MNHKIISKVTSSVLLCTMMAYSVPIFAYTKEETVYSKLDTNGKNYETLVSNHLINDSKDSLLYDLSDLINIKNVNGNETFMQDGSNLIWNTNGNDIYYQGESNKDLPIECTVSYELDGREISSKELAGKSGRVKITIKYINKDEHIVNINGKNEKMYTPFITMCGTIINNKKNRNIKISNGKVIDDGSKTMVFGIALPGLKDSLSLSDDMLNIPDTVEITMDSTDFEFNNIFNFVTPKIIEDSDLDIFNSLDEIYSKVNTLESSSKQLVNGANTLKTGTKVYLEKSKEFNSAMKQVSYGVNEATSNYSKIDSGISTLNKNSGALTSGAKQISEGTETVASYLKTISDGLGELQDGTSTLKSGEVKVSAGIKALKSGLTAPITGDNTSSSNAKAATADTTNTDAAGTPPSTPTGPTLLELNQSTIKTLKTAVANNPSLATQYDPIITLLEADTKALTQTIGTLGQLEDGMTDIQAGTNKLLSGEAELKEGVDTLASKTEELAKGSKTLYEGTLAVANGTKSLNSGSSELKKGLNTLNSGASSLLDANNQLTSGAGELSNGAKTLSDGMTKFDKEGISKICNYLNGDLKDISIRLEKLQELARGYNNFTALNDDTSRKC